VCDLVPERAQQLCAAHGGAAFPDWRDALARLHPAIVVACTSNQTLLPVATAALASGTHVLIEKPMGRNAGEARAIAAAARAARRTFKVGFNHRWHPGIRRACEHARSGAFGPILFVRCVYGHGGRPGYEGEWRGSPEAGGGELLDQGVHVLDLLHWLLGPPAAVHCELADFCWPIAPLEDNAFALLRWSGGQIATFHTSWTQWRNRFELQIYCREGSLEVAGLGGSYGTETLAIARRNAGGGAPASWTECFPEPDSSWQREWDEFVSAIAGNRQPPAWIDDGVAVMEILERLYQAARAQPATPPSS
jgi:predicted dehydrogenase